jgi:Protein of unknown function (DUF1800)
VNRRADPWAPYRAGPDARWNRRRVVHLHRRAGFAASWLEIERDLKDGPEASIARVLKGEVRADSAPKDFSATTAALAGAAITADNPDRLKAWWVHRMLCGPDPLGERLTLLWHDHFATSNQKVNDLSAMRRQNEVFRELARAPFGELLNAAVREPATLVGLDAPANRKGHPNLNARAGRLDGTVGAGPLLSTQRGRLARRPVVAFIAFARRASQFRVGAGRGIAGRKPGAARCGRRDQATRKTMRLRRRD